MRAALPVLAVALTALAARADLPVAPPPRAVADDGSRPPVPPPEPPKKAEDPAAVVERIIKNSKEVGDRLAKTDTGTDTRGTQKQILKDIDDLINRQDDPPPKDNKDNKDNKDKDKNDMNPDMPPPMGGDMMKDKGMDKSMDKGMDKGMGMPMGKDMGMGMGMGMGKDMGMGMPMGGMNDAPPKSGERRPRMGDPNGGDKKDKGDKGGKGMDHPPIDKNGKEPKDKSGKETKPGDAKNPKGGNGGGNVGGKDGKQGGLPFDDDVAKDVWGHLPDKLRQQMTQFYKDDVMPKYAELLKLYYSSLSEKGQPPPAVPKK